MENRLLHEAIAKRYSVRKFDARPIETEKLDTILNFSPERLSDSDIRFVPVDGDKMRGRLETSFANYFNPPTYLVMVAKEAPNFILDSGYRGEQAILAATALGLGTCWLGGLFIEDKIRSLIGIDGQHRAMIVFPIGYPTKRLTARAIEGALRLGGGSTSRKPLREIVFAEKYGAPMESFTGEYAKWENIFKAVRVAPSWANYQPWRFVVNGGAVYAIVVPPRPAQGSKGAQMKGDLDYSLLDLGISMSHFSVACKAEGVSGKWELLSGDASELRARLQAPDADRIVAVWRK